jgi:hypothetical protein
MWASPAGAQETFNLNADGSNADSPPLTVYNWTTAPWVPVAPATGYPGLTGTDDVANINFREFNNADGTGDPDVDINLEGMMFNIGTLNLTESATGNTDGNFVNGTLNLNNINYTSGGREIDFETSGTRNFGPAPFDAVATNAVTINAGSGLLTINTVGNTLDFDGNVTGTGGITINGTQRVALRAANTSITGAWTMNNTAGTGLDFDGAGNSGIVLDSLTTNAAAGAANSFRIDRTSGAAGTIITVNVNGATTFNSPRINFQVENPGAGEFAAWNLNTVALNPPSPTFVWDLQTNTTVNIQGGFTEATPTAATFQGAGNLNFNSQSTRTGSSTLQRGLWMNYGVAQTAPQTVFVNEGGAFGGELGGQTYASGTAPAPGVVVFTSNGFGILVDDDAGNPPANSPTVAQVGPRGVLRGVRSSGTTHYGGLNAPGQIYGGVAFGAWTLAGDYSGDLTADEGDLRIYMATNRAFTPTATTGGEIATLNTPTGLVEVRGPGTLTLNSRIDNNSTDGTYTTINRVGDAASQNTDLISFDTSGGATGNPGKSLPAGKTVNVTNGRVRFFDASDVIAPDATINVNDGAGFLIDRVLTTGRLNVNNGAGFAHPGLAYINNQDRFSGLTVNPATPTDNSITFATGSLLVLDADMDTTTAKIPENVDIVLDDANADAFTGKGIVLGQGRRLATPSNTSVDLTGGTGVSAAAGATRVILSASAGDTLDVNDAINLAGVTLQAGSAPFSNPTSGTNFTRTLDAQTGTVGVGPVTTRDIEVVSGLLRFENASIPALQNGSVTTAVGGVGGATTILSGGAVEVEYNQGTDPAGIQIDEAFVIPENFSPATSPGLRTFLIDRASTVTGGNDRIDLNNVIVGNNATITAEIQDAGSNARMTLNLLGTVTTAEGIAQGIGNNSDFTLKNVRGINADGTANTTDPRTVNIGFTPPGTTPPGSAAAPNSGDYILVQSVAGQIDSNVTVNLINGQVNFIDGAVLNGTVNVATRTGDFFIRIQAGQDGTAPFFTGTGVINHGQASGVVEDVAGFVNEVATGGTPLRNSTDVRVNILPVAQNPAGAILRADRGADSNVNGLFEFNNVHVNGSILQLDSANEQNVMADVVLDGDVIITPQNNADDANRVFVGQVTDPDSGSNIRVRGTSNIRFTDAVAASNFFVGGGTDALDQTGRVVFQTSGALPTPLATSASLNLTGQVELGQGGQIDVNTGITAGMRLAGNGDLDVNAALGIPSGKRLTGSNSVPIELSPILGGILTIMAGGTIAPGDSAGVLRINNGPINLADGARYEYEAGPDTATSDLVALTGTDGKPEFAGNWILHVSSLGGVDPTDRTFVLFDGSAAPTSVGNPTITYDPGTGWSGGTVSVQGDDVVLTGVVPEPGTAGLLAVAGLGLLARRRRRA